MSIEDTIYRSWANGRCPCCHANICEWIDGTKPQAIGEGVRLCGHCISMQHDTPMVVNLLLESIIYGRTTVDTVRRSL